MGIFSWVCLGILTGLLINRAIILPNVLLKGLTYAVSVLGALAGGYIGIQQGWNWGDITTFNIFSFFAAFTGMVILTGIYLACIAITSRSRNHQKIL